MNTSCVGLSVSKNEADKSGMENHETDIRQEMFRLMEDERETIVRILQEDVAQLISIAQMALPGKNAQPVHIHLSMALAKLRSLIFELHPHSLSELSLAAALTELFNKRFAQYPNRFSLDLNPLPQNMNKHMEIAVFRLVQKALSHFSDAKLAYFGLQISRTGSLVCIKSRFELEPSDTDFTSSDFCETELKKALNALVYIFHGEMHCQALSDNQMEFIILLDQNKVQ